ncbi:MAG TPA: ClpXP protease specificity-enhancing factor SspB [Rickettsia endosymbiont of Pyrocoelia pectoralis]|nr:ClpXP protease specificity-enhancing factor SspB [Rickettsia endosymbiont of Pyrocoelia pectoralis]
MNLEYKKFLNEAMLELVKKILAKIQHDNLYWDQLIYISYKTDHPAVILPLKVRQKYSKEITIVLQHQFENLLVKETGFSLTVSFDGIKENIYIPFDALISFVDSSNNYSLNFNKHLELQKHYQDEAVKIKQQISEEIDNSKIEETTKLSENVIMLDKFRNSSKTKPIKPHE